MNRYRPLILLLRKKQADFRRDGIEAATNEKGREFGDPTCETGVDALLKKPQLCPRAPWESEPNTG